MTIFRSAITGDDGQVDAGYLAMFWLLVVVLNAIPFMCVFAAWSMYLDAKHVFHVQDLGVGIGAVCGGFATAIGAVGLFRAGDKSHAVSSSTTTIQSKDQSIRQEVVSSPPEPAPPEDTENHSVRKNIRSGRPLGKADQPGEA